MFDKLLLAVDPSKRLKPAREYAIALSEKLEVPLVAAFISNPKKAGTSTASLDTRDGFTALGKRQLKQIVDANKSIKIICSCTNVICNNYSILLYEWNICLWKGNAYDNSF